MIDEIELKYSVGALLYTPALNGKIAESVQTGFCRENHPIIQELVKLYRKVN